MSQTLDWNTILIGGAIVAAFLIGQVTALVGILIHDRFVLRNFRDVH